MKPFVIYFPQFYPTIINDKVWGYGFTDWHLVSNANLNNSWSRRAPLRGYYDGSDKNIQGQIVNEIKDFNLGGVALYHYWFFNQHILNSFEKNIVDKELPEVDWFIIWATESWSKRWIGDDEVIIDLNSSPSKDDIFKHCNYLVKCFESGNYLHIDGNPLFTIYNISHFDNPKYIVDMYKNIFRQLGYNVVLGSFVKNPSDYLYHSLFDVNYLFEPRLFFGFNRSTRGVRSEIISKFIKRFVGDYFHSVVLKFMDILTQNGTKYTSESFLSYFSSDDRKAFADKFDCYQDVLSPAWNNFPRYGDRFTSLEPIDANVFGNLVENSTNNNSVYPVLLNAWNEWSEGAAVEPCYYEKTKYLDLLVNKDFK